MIRNFDPCLLKNSRTWMDIGSREFGAPNKVGGRDYVARVHTLDKKIKSETNLDYAFTKTLMQFITKCLGIDVLIYLFFSCTENNLRIGKTTSTGVKTSFALGLNRHKKRKTIPMRDGILIRESINSLRLYFCIICRKAFF